MKNELIAANGSVQALDVPQEVKDLYKTTWEIKQKVLIDMAADRAQHPSNSFITSMLSFHARKPWLRFFCFRCGALLHVFLDPAQTICGCWLARPGRSRTNAD